MTNMCRVCIDFYEMPHPAMQLIDDTCHCCDRRHVTVFCLSPEQIDNFNKEYEDNEKK